MLMASFGVFSKVAVTWPKKGNNEELMVPLLH